MASACGMPVGVVRRRRRQEARELWASWGVQQFCFSQAVLRQPKPGVRCGAEGWNESSQSQTDWGATVMLAWKAAKEVATMILVASADVGASEFMVEKGRVDEFGFVTCDDL